MALDDIVLGETDNELFIVEIVAGTLNSPLDILTESDNYNGNLISEIPNPEIFYPFIF